MKSNGILIKESTRQITCPLKHFTSQLPSRQQSKAVQHDTIGSLTEILAVSGGQYDNDTMLTTTMVAIG